MKIEGTLTVIVTLSIFFLLSGCKSPRGAAKRGRLGDIDMSQIQRSDSEITPLRSNMLAIKIFT